MLNVVDGTCWRCGPSFFFPSNANPDPSESTVKVHHGVQIFRYVSSSFYRQHC